MRISNALNPTIIDFHHKNETFVRPRFHSHPHYELYLFLEGSCTYLIGNKIYELAPGDLILMDGMTLHRAKVDLSKRYVRSVLHFEPAGLKPLIDGLAVPFVLKPFQHWGSLRLRFTAQQKEEIVHLFDELNELYKMEDHVSNARCQLAFMNLLILIYEHCQTSLQSEEKPPSGKGRTVQRIATYLEHHFTEDLELDELERQLHLSKYYISTVFKEVTGVTIFEYIFQRRINQAKILFMLEPSSSVTEVCFQVGFKHLSHFSRIFKQQVGQTPAEYRNLYRS